MEDDLLILDEIGVLGGIKAELLSANRINDKLGNAAFLSESGAEALSKALTSEIQLKLKELNKLLNE